METNLYSNHFAIVLLTYNRLEYAVRTLITTLDHVHTQAPLSVHIASDGDTDEYVELLSGVVLAHRPNAMLTTSNSQRAGYGANYNLALQTVHTYATHVLPLEDDWELTRDLDLDLFASALDELRAGCVRLGYLGYTQPLHATFEYALGRHWLRISPDSEEPHVFAGHPRLETIEWQRSVGPWVEGLFPGDTEFEVAHRPAAREGVIWPIQEVKPNGDMFAHIGTERSW